MRRSAPGSRAKTRAGVADSRAALPVSCIIPTIDRGPEVVQAIRDLLAQQPPPLEILVMDQTRRHASEVEAELERLRRDPRVRYFRLSVPNVSRARNLAIAEARGEVLLFLDDDVRLGPGFVRAHWRNYVEDPSIHAVAGQVLLPGQKPATEPPNRYYWKYIGWSFFPMNYALRCRTVNLPSGNFSIRKEWAMRIGGFDENYVKTCGEDAEFSWRFYKAGGRAIYDPAASLLHLATPKGGNRAEGRNEFLQCDRVRWRLMFYYWLRHFGLRAWPECWRYLRGGLIRKQVFMRPWLLPRGICDLAAGFVQACDLVRRKPALPFLKGRTLPVRRHSFPVTRAAARSPAK